MSTQKAPYKVKHSHYLDMQTGFIKAATEVIETDERYRNRFIPWTAPIPKNGRVNLAEWQKQMSVSAGKSADDIAKWEEFERWKASQAGSPTAVSTPGTETKSEATASTVAPAPTSTVVQPTAPEVKAPETINPSQRYDMIMTAMSSLTVNDMTKSPVNPMPSVAALQRLTGLMDIQGPERESIFADFKKGNPNWQPKAA
ncbi:MAG: hypothetical protein C4586_08315 [Anaerolineaceae bacterium]|nr:MAG: hypothetical protein C4586_08315 [Anaerolineaceae bacterium]